jgi:hypothetical protein
MRMDVYYETEVVALESQARPMPDAGGWRRYQALHDWQTSLWNFKPREVAPDPEVNRIGVFEQRESHNKVSLTEAMQFFWAELLALRKFGKGLDALTVDERGYINNKMTVVMGPAFAFTNRSSPEAANYVSGEMLDAEPAKLAPLMCGGNTIWGKPAGANRDGDEMIEVYSFLRDDIFPLPSLDDPRVLWATAIYDERNVFPFSHLGDGVGVPYPLITAERYYYPLSGLVEYSHAERARPLYVRDGVAAYA